VTGVNLVRGFESLPLRYAAVGSTTRLDDEGYWFIVERRRPTVPEPSLVMLGPPGSGKGTQAKPLAAECGLAYVSTGDLLRGAAGSTAREYMQAGELVPDEIVLDVVADAIRGRRFMLDGFPRNVAQAEALDRELDRLGMPRPHAILLDVPDEVLVDRLSGRRICELAGHEYHVVFRRPLHDGVCDIDGSRLVRRADDEPETIQRRLAVYHEQTEPLIAYYEAGGRLLRIDGAGDADAIRARLAGAVRA
jgi:adenylate kinase